MAQMKLNIPEAFYSEESRCDYLVSSDMKKLWAVCLDLLYVFDKVCKDYGLTYYAMYGTLIGAMRHKGFIPWDDDLDLAMPRADFEKLISIGDAFEDPYFLQTEQSDLGFSRIFARLRNSSTTGIQAYEGQGERIHYNQGIFIDIFPIDSFPDEPEACDRFIRSFSKATEKMQRFSRWSTRYRKTVGEGILI